MRTETPNNKIKYTFCSTARCVKRFTGAWRINLQPMGRPLKWRCWICVCLLCTNTTSINRLSFCFVPKRSHVSRHILSHVNDMAHNFVVRWFLCVCVCVLVWCTWVSCSHITTLIYVHAVSFISRYAFINACLLFCSLAFLYYLFSSDSLSRWKYSMKYILFEQRRRRRRRRSKKKKEEEKHVI